MFDQLFKPLGHLHKPVRVALIGVTGYGKVHFEHLLQLVELGLAKPVAAVVINPQEAFDSCSRLRELGVRIYADHESMWKTENGNVDLCFIPTGIHVHAAMTISALRSGANVLVEKPLCGSLAEAEEMLEVSKQVGRTISVGFQDMYDPNVLMIKHLLVQGNLGAIKRIRGWALWPRPRSYYRRNEWAGRLRVENSTVLDSPFNNAMAHFVNLVLFFGGGCLEGMAAWTDLRAELLRVHDIESFDTGSLFMRTLGGVELSFHGSHSSRINIQPQVIIEAERGTIIWSSEGPIELIQEGVKRDLGVATPNAQKQRNMFQAVLNRCHDDNQWTATAEMAISHTRLMNELHERFAIEDMDSNCWSLDNLAGDEQPVIHQIESKIVEASEKGEYLGRLIQQVDSSIRH